MKVKKYSIKRINQSCDNLVNQWKITIEVMPNWFERVFLHKIQSTIYLTGSCSHWTWQTGENASYGWKLWAYEIVNNKSLTIGQ